MQLLYTSLIILFITNVIPLFHNFYLLEIIKNIMLSDVAELNGPFVEEEIEKPISLWFGDIENMFFPTEEECAKNLPKPKKTEIKRNDFIHCAWEQPAFGNLYYIHSFDKKNHSFFGFVKLDEWEDAEWGYIDYEELKADFENYKRTCVAIFPMTSTFKDGKVKIEDIPHNSSYLCKNL